MLGVDLGFTWDDYLIEYLRTLMDAEEFVIP